MFCMLINNILGCSTDTILITELPIINPSAVVTHVDCFGNSTGSFTGFPVLRTSPYNLLWNPGSLSGSIISNLAAGEYTLTVTDVNNCQEVDTFVISEPDALSVSITQNGFVLTSSTIPLGGTAPYKLFWIEQSSSSGMLSD